MGPVSRVGKIWSVNLNARNRGFPPFLPIPRVEEEGERFHGPSERWWVRVSGERAHSLLGGGGRKPSYVRAQTQESSPPNFFLISQSYLVHLSVPCGT